MTTSGSSTCCSTARRFRKTARFVQTYRGPATVWSLSIKTPRATPPRRSRCESETTGHCDPRVGPCRARSRRPSARIERAFATSRHRALRLRLHDLASRCRCREPSAKNPATVIAARRLNRAAGTLAASVLADSAVEHYRGSFKNKAMFTPLVVSALTLATSIHGTSDSRRGAHAMRDTTLCRGGCDWPGRHRVSHLQRRQKDRRFLLAEPVLSRAAWRTHGHSVVGTCRLLLRARSRQLAGRDADDLQSPGRQDHGGGNGRGASRHDRRGRADASCAAPSTIRS